MSVEFWSGDFGTEYSKRNVSLVDNNKEFFSRIFDNEPYEFKSVSELGCGIGQNLKAIQELYYDVEIKGCDINHFAIRNSIAGKVQKCDAFEYEEKADLVLTKGFLIHVAPDDLPRMYDKLFSLSNKYILICEYYSKTPQMIEYRGNIDKLWKRDFCAELLDRFPTLALKGYGFAYDRDPYPQDNLNWFLLEKKG